MAAHSRPPGSGRIKPPQQERSRHTLHAILDATERLLDDHLFDDLPLQRIIEEAGVSTGSFYARFPSKESMLPALIQRYNETLTASVLEAYGCVPPNAGLEARVAAMVGERVKRYRRWRGLLRSLVVILRVRPNAIDPRILRQAAMPKQAILDLLAPVRGHIKRRDPDAAIQRGFYFISAICRERILFPDSPHAREVTISDDMLIQELTRLLLGYLQ